MEHIELTFNNIMLDLETTGTRGDRHGILQIAAYRFGTNRNEIDPTPFNRCLRLPAWRSWSESTRQWWHKDGTMRGILHGLQQRAEDPKVVLEAFRDWLLESDDPTLWAKPTHFEWPFLQGYFEDFDVLLPLHYRYANDMNSFIRGIHFPDEVPDNLQAPMRGPAHDAGFDVLQQIETVWNHTDYAKGAA